MRPSYTASTVQAAELAFGAFRDEWATGAVAAWERAWEEFTPFLAFAPEIRKVIYTRNLIESINFQLRKVTKARGSFPTDEAAKKLLTSRYATSATSEEVKPAPAPTAGRTP